MKKAKLALALVAPMLLLASCQQASFVGNHNIGMGNMSYYYVYVNSPMIGKNYYHISIWKEYDPEGVAVGKGGEVACYIGLEFETYTTKTHYYFYERDLSYIFTGEYVVAFGEAIE